MTINTFNFNGQDLRSTLIDGEPWFVALDICRALDINIIKARNEPNVTIACAKLNPDERTLLRIEGSKGRSSMFVSESGLYKLTMRSDKPEAKDFQNWVTREVLPSVRKTGGYLLNEAARPTAHADTKEAMPLPEGFAQMFQMLFAPIVQPLVDEAKALREEVTALRQADASHGAIILSMQAHLEKMASGEEPSDVWMNGSLTRDMSDGHIRNAIKWAKKNHVPYDVLTKEQARRIRLKKKVAA